MVLLEVESMKRVACWGPGGITLLKKRDALRGKVEVLCEVDGGWTIAKLGAHDDERASADSGGTLWSLAYSDGVGWIVDASVPAPVITPAVRRAVVTYRERGLA